MATKPKTSGRGISASNRGKQQAFVKAYLAQPPDARDEEQAAIEAGYSPKSAASAARRVLTYPHIRAQILERKERVLELSAIDEAWFMNRLAELWEVDLGEFFDDDNELKHVGQLTPNAQKLVASFDIQTERITERTETGDESEILVRSRTTNIKLIDRYKVLRTIGETMRVNAFGTKQNADKNESFAQLLKAASSALNRNETIDIDLEALKEG